MKGAQAEDLALAHLQSHGLELLARNVRARGGELDLVMRRGQTLVVVEVRQRSDPRFGSAAESVDARKQQRILLATQQYLQQHPEFSALAVRFDVVALDAQQRIEWLQDAFEA